MKKFEELKEEYKIKLNELKEEYENLYDKVSKFECLIEKANKEYFEYVKSTIDRKLIYDKVDGHKIHVVKKDEVVPVIYDKYLTKYEFIINETYEDVVIGKYRYSSNKLTHELLPRNFSDSQFDWNISDGLKKLFNGYYDEGDE